MSRPPIAHRNTCRLCNSRNLEVVLSLAPSPIAGDYLTADRLESPQEKYPLDLCLCMDCGAVQLPDTIDPEILFRNYTDVISDSAESVAHCRAMAGELMRKFLLEKDSLVVEAGCNDGTLLRFFKEKGMRVLGVDPAVEIAKKTTESGIEVIPDFFTSEIASQILKNEGRVSLLIANHALTHGENLGDIAQGVRRILMPDGVFVFEAAYLVDVVGRMMFDNIVHEHLCHHAVRPLAGFFDLHGLELFDVERIPAKGGLIRGYVQLKGGPRSVEHSVAELVALEQGRGVASPETYKTWGERIGANKSALLELLAKIRSEGKLIAGYGATASVTTLLHHFELGDKLDLLVDDNVVKQGRYCPGYRLRVVPSSALDELNPAYVVVLDWMHAEEIMKKTHAHAARGGRFIIPNPEVKVV